MSEQRMLIVTNTQGILMISLKNKMEEYGYQASIVSGNIKDVTKFEEPYETVILYSDEELAENTQVLVYLRDKCVEDNIPFFVIGNSVR